MRKIDKLRKSARESCEFREHDMGNFKHDDNLAISRCKICDMSVLVNTKPQANEIDIMGNAVALNCPGCFSLGP